MADTGVRASSECEWCKCGYESKRRTSRFCSAKCRVSAGRSVTNVSVTQTQPVTLRTDTVAGSDTLNVVASESLVDPRIGPEVYYHPRTHPECLNWEAWMDVDELKQNGFKANRVSIPGDWDYVGMA